MFFLARSTFCIGLVAFLLPGSEERGPWQGLAETATAAAMHRLQAACGGDVAGCAEAGSAKLLLAGRIPADPSTMKRKSTSTLLPSDFVPAWRGPVPRS